MKKSIITLVLLPFLMLSCKEKTISKSALNTIAIADSTKNISTVKNKLAHLASTPPMGWNSWNWFGKHEINEEVIKETIDAMVNEGFRDAGYNYVVIDGGWRDTKLGPNNELLTHPTKFPNGIKPLADYAHSKGLKLGVHVVPGSHDCGGDPVGGFNNEAIHVKQFVDWGLDFIKLDLCRNNIDPCTDCAAYRSGWTEKTIEDSYRKWGDLFVNCGRDILFSISAYTYRDWYPEISNMARTTGDIEAKIHKGAFFNKDTINHPHTSVMEIAQVNNHASNAAGNGYWNDPDMMVTGNHGLSQEEQKSHFALWSIMSSPLFIGSDVRNMSAFEKELLLNKEIIAINQDPTEQGRIIRRDETSQIWLKKLKDGKVALLFVSLFKRKPRNITIKLSDIGFDGEVEVRDVFNKKDLGIQQGFLSKELNTNESFLIVVSKK